MRLRDKRLEDFGIDCKQAKEIKRMCKAGIIPRHVIEAVAEQSNFAYPAALTESFIIGRGFYRVSKRRYQPIKSDDFYAYQRRCLGIFHRLLVTGGIDGLITPAEAQEGRGTVKERILSARRETAKTGLRIVSVAVRWETHDRQIIGLLTLENYGHGEAGKHISALKLYADDIESLWEQLQNLTAIYAPQHKLSVPLPELGECDGWRCSRPVPD